MIYKGIILRKDGIQQLISVGIKSSACQGNLVFWVVSLPLSVAFSFLFSAVWRLFSVVSCIFVPLQQCLRWFQWLRFREIKIGWLISHYRNSTRRVLGFLTSAFYRILGKSSFSRLCRVLQLCPIAWFLLSFCFAQYSDKTFAFGSKRIMV